MFALQTNALRRYPEDYHLAPSLTATPPPCRVMVVDDDQWMRTYLDSVLKAAGYQVDVADSGSAALQLLRAGCYDILFTDFQMPGMDGLALCERVRSEFPHNPPYVLMFTVKDTREDRYAGLNSGADEYIIKGVPKSEVLAKVDVGRRIQMSRHALAQREDASRGLSFIDLLTDAHNLQYLARQMPKEIERARYRQQALSIASCRIEEFEQLARQYGQPVADAAVRAFADHARQYLCAPQDWFARVGDDRFILVLPRTGFNEAQRLARKLSRRYGTVPVNTEAGSIRCSVKIDITACEPRDDSAPTSS